MKVTEAVAEKVRAAVAEQFSPWSMDLDENDEMVPGKYQPEVHMDYGGHGPAIVWEDGAPYDWPMLAGGGGIEEEFGFKVPAAKLPKGVEFLEAIDAVAVRIVAVGA